LINIRIKKDKTCSVGDKNEIEAEAGFWSPNENKNKPCNGTIGRSRKSNGLTLETTVEKSSL
jgi:hypothetical protein